MPTLPIPMIAAIVLGVLFLRMWATDRRHAPLALLLALCGLQALIISLTQHYGVAALLRIQPITATLIPPVAWIAFQTSLTRRRNLSDSIHLAGPLLTIGLIFVAPPAIDALIPALFIGYGAAILWRLRQVADTLPHARLEAGNLPVLIWQVIGIALIASALSDFLIVLAQATGNAHVKPWIISFYSVGNLAVIGALSISGALATEIPEETAQPETPQQDAELDAEIMARLATLMGARQPFLDPDLTLSKLARMLHIPAKQLSAAINRSTGDNVSRYINSARIHAAQAAILSGESVTQAMFSGGFQTKSNFNREFLRITGQSPSDWRKAQRSVAE